MVLKPEPIFEAVESLTGAGDARQLAAKGVRVVLLSPQGRVLTQSLAAELAGSERVVIICGRYEGVDERVAQALATERFHRDYVLSAASRGGRVVDAVVRLCQCAGNETSAVNESFSQGC